VNERSLTPLQIAVLSLAFGAHERGETIAVWGSWQTAAQKLTDVFALIPHGTAVGTRELEFTTLHGRHRKGRPGRAVHLYALRDLPYWVGLASRCADAVRALPSSRCHATWRDLQAPPPPREGRRCPGCACTPDRPCLVTLDDECGDGQCVPAGVLGLETCSACAA